MPRSRLAMLFAAVLVAGTAVLVTMVALLVQFRADSLPAAVWGSLVVSLSGAGVGLCILAIVHLSFIATRRAAASRRELLIGDWTRVWSGVATGDPVPSVATGETRIASEAAARLLQVLGGDEAGTVCTALQRCGVIEAEIATAVSGLRAGSAETVAALERLAWIATPLAVPLFEVAAAAGGRASRAGLLGLMRVVAASGHPEELLESVVTAVDEYVAAEPAAAGARPFLAAVLSASRDKLCSVARALIDSSRHEEARAAALDALGLSQRPEVAEIGAAVLQGGATGETKAAACAALARLGHVPGTVSGMILAASASSSEPLAVRVTATRALVGVDQQDALATLWLLLADTSWDVRRAAADTLMRCGRTGEELVIRAKAEHPDRFARDVSAMALAAISSSRAAGQRPSRPAAATEDDFLWLDARSPRTGSAAERSPHGVTLARGPA